MLSDVRKQKFEYLFRVFDKSGSGDLTANDIKSLFEGLAIYDEEVKAAAQASRRWWLLLSLFADKDKDKLVTTLEWQAWLNGMSIEAGDDSETEGSKTFLRWADATYSLFSNQNNEVTSGEYGAWFSGFGLEGDADESFQKLDVNGNGIITRSEFIQRLREFLRAEDTGAAGNYLWGNPF